MQDGSRERDVSRHESEYSTVPLLMYLETPVNASHCDCDDSDFTTVPFGMHGPRVWTTVEGRSDAVAVTVVGYCSTHSRAPVHTARVLALSLYRESTNDIVWESR